MANGVVAGDGFTVTAGCGKQFATCKAKFAIGANFRGFPQVPGTDFLLFHPKQGGKNDGGSRLR
jgi:uncharacterized phage protein (TIGR02218 family)